MKNIVIFGAPGSGKGTQSDKMIEKYGLNHISTGDVLRSEIKKGSELGKTAASYIDNGQLIPDDLMVSILAKVYDAFGDHKGVIFDGFPRTIPQAEALKKMLDERGAPPWTAEWESRRQRGDHQEAPRGVSLSDAAAYQVVRAGGNPLSHRRPGLARPYLQ